MLCGANLGPILGHLGSILDPCWVIWWAMWRSMDVSGGKNLTPTETVSVGVQPSSFSVQFWCYVGRMLGNLGSKCLTPSKDPTKSPEKLFFSWVSKGNLTLDGVRFPGRTHVENLRSVGVCGRENRTPTKNDFL